MRGGFDSRRPHQVCNPQIQNMKKSANSLVTFAIASLFAAGLAFAAAEKV